MIKKSLFTINKRIYKTISKTYLNHKLHNWYYRSKEYLNLQNNSRFKYFEVQETKDSLCLNPIDLYKINLIRTRDYSSLISDEANNELNDLLVTNLENINEYDEDGFLVFKKDYNNKEKINQIYSPEDFNKSNKGLFWLFSGDNKQMMMDHLFEYNNLVPNPQIISRQDKKVLSQFYVHLQQAPLNPKTNSSFVIEHNYFNILDYPNYQGMREIDFSEIEIFTEKIEKQIEQFIKEKNIDEIILGGFSQGACMIMNTIFKLKPEILDKVKGVISFSGFLFEKTQIDYDVLQKINFIIINGLNDDIVTIREARDSFDRLKKSYDKLKFTCKENSYNTLKFIEENGLHHSFSATSLKLAGEFINEIINQNN